MSDPNASVPLPGWYPDGTGAQRWWDGRAWTAYVAAPAVGQGNPRGAATAQLGDRPRIDERAPVDSVWTWALAVLPILVSAAMMLHPGFRMLLTLSSGNLPQSQLGGLFDVLWFVLLQAAIGLLSLAGQAFLASRDHAHLRELGVVRPFPWAAALLGSLVYLIGRHVVLRKVTPTAGLPMWVCAGLTALFLVVALVVSFGVALGSLSS